MSKKLINGKILSIQLGREETRIVLVGKNSEILHGITVPTPAGAVEDGIIHDQEAISAMLKEALETPEFKGVRQAVFSLCTSQVILETATTPDLPKAKLEKLIQANADMYFPVDIQDYRLVWEVVDVRKNDSGAKEAAVQLWAVPNEMLRGYYQAANACGLSVAAIDYCGHSVATAVGATFARPAKPPKAKAPKAPKDPEAPQEPKPKKKIDWNAEITFGRKKKVEPEVSQNEEAGSREIPGTDMHILMDKELLGLTFVQKGQVVYQRFYRCGSDPTYQFGELAMMVEYFQNQEIGRGSEIRGYVSGPGSMDPEMVELLAGMVGIPLEPFQSGMDQCWLLCAGAARTTLEFGNPDFNKAVRVRRTINTDLWQYAAILASGAALVAVVLMLLNSRLGWNSEISQLENTRDLLKIQSDKVNGFKENYDNYETEYAAYDRDWDALFNSLHTYNDNLVFVLEELENVMPANTSVTDIIIDSDSVMISFACDDKEEAAYLIMSLRDMEYVDVNTISNLIGGGKGAATDYGTPIEEVMPPTEGGTGDDLVSDEFEYKWVTTGQISGLTNNEAYKDYFVTPVNKQEHISLKAFLNRHSMKFEDRREVVLQMLQTNPFMAVEIGARLWPEHGTDKDKDGNVDPYEEQFFVNIIDLAQQAMGNATENHLTILENWIQDGGHREKTYVHYLEAYNGQWGEVDFKLYSPYISQEGAAVIKEKADSMTLDSFNDYAHADYPVEWLNEWITGCAWPQGGVECGCVCPHTDEKVVYAGTDPVCLTPMHKVSYEICGEEIRVEECTGDNGTCQFCGGSMTVIGTHQGATTLHQIEGMRHEIICTTCNEVIKVEICKPVNGSNTCICEREVICNHPEEECNFEHIQGTATHRWSCTCGAEDIRPCEFEGETCQDCSYVCDHKEQYEPIIKDGGNWHKIFCDCGNVAKEEACVDTVKDQKCDTCGGPVPEPVVLPITSDDITKLEEYYGKRMDDESLKTFITDKNPSFYQKKAALINLFTMDAFAVNEVYDKVTPFASMFNRPNWGEAKTFEEKRNNMGALILEVAGSEAAESYLPWLEGKLFDGNGAESESNNEKYNLEAAYVYFLKVAMEKESIGATVYPHLLDSSRSEVSAEETERIQLALDCVKKMWDDEAANSVTAKVDYEYLMSMYLLNETKKIDKETLEALEVYFNEGFDDGKHLEMASKYEAKFDEALTSDDVMNILVAKLNLFDYTYDGKVTQGDPAFTLFKAYRDNLIKNNETLLQVLQKTEKQAEIEKNKDQDKTLEDHETRIEALEKEIESLKKSAAEKAKEEEGAAGGGGGGYRDTRVFLDIGLLYTEELWDQELQRKGLDRDAKIPKLELEVG